jgi:hypothetical protein
MVTRNPRASIWWARRPKHQIKELEQALREAEAKGSRVLSRDMWICPVAVMGTARWWPRDLPSRGHRTCPE